MPDIDITKWKRGRKQVRFAHTWQIELERPVYFNPETLNYDFFLGFTDRLGSNCRVGGRVDVQKPNVIDVWSISGVPMAGDLMVCYLPADAAGSQIRDTVLFGV